MARHHIIDVSIETILGTLREGVHIVDASGRTVYYNRAMEEIEGISSDEIIGKHLLDVFSGWTQESSTLLTVLDKGTPIVDREQSYLNMKGEIIKTINTTLPILEADVVVGAVEISRNVTQVVDLSSEILELRQKLMKPRKSPQGIKQYHFDQLIGKNAAYAEAIGIAHRAARSISSVLIYGDTGTGKELFAQSIHYEGDRRDQVFIAQNCAAIPESLLEGILFGTTKGSFTGAEDRAGIFEQAHGGTLFLDEINSMSSGLQAKLLRVLQENYIRRIGGSKDIPVDVRIIAATNAHPEALIADGVFRKDLYYRLNVINIRIPSLSERPDDIPILVDHFIRLYNDQLNKDVWMISEELMDAFKGYAWPGNVRELKNFIEAAMNLVADEHVITREHLPSHVAEMLMRRSNRNPAEQLPEDLNAHLLSIERDVIQKALAANGHNISKTARALKLSRQNLQYKLKHLAI